MKWGNNLKFGVFYQNLGDVNTLYVVTCQLLINVKNDINVATEIHISKL